MNTKLQMTFWWYSLHQTSRYFVDGSGCCVVGGRGCCKIVRVIWVYCWLEEKRYNKLSMDENMSLSKNFWVIVPLLLALAVGVVAADKREQTVKIWIYTLDFSLKEPISAQEAFYYKPKIDFEYQIWVFVKVWFLFLQRNYSIFLLRRFFCWKNHNNILITRKNDWTTHFFGGNFLYI